MHDRISTVSPYLLLKLNRTVVTSLDDIMLLQTIEAFVIKGNVNLLRLISVSVVV